MKFFKFSLIVFESLILVFLLLFFECWVVLFIGLDWWLNFVFDLFRVVGFEGLFVCCCIKGIVLLFICEFLCKIMEIVCKVFFLFVEEISWELMILILGLVGGLVIRFWELFIVVVRVLLCCDVLLEDIGFFLSFVFGDGFEFWDVFWFYFFIWGFFVFDFIWVGEGGICILFEMVGWVL